MRVLDDHFGGKKKRKKRLGGIILNLLARVAPLTQSGGVLIAEATRDADPLERALCDDAKLFSAAHNLRQAPRRDAKGRERGRVPRQRLQVQVAGSPRRGDTSAQRDARATQTSVRIAPPFQTETRCTPYCKTL